MSTEQQWDEMISYWFSKTPKEWFSPPEGLDSEIRNKYLDLVHQARSGALDSWAKEPRGVVCLVLLLDQFPRNIFRGSPESFSSDLKAQKLVTQAIVQEFDKELGKTSKLQQSMLYMPFMHAEDLMSQIACEALYDSLAKSCDKGSDDQKWFENGVEFSRRHLKCIAQLGRFPKRNDAIGRPNTEEEDKYLADHPQGF